MVRRPKDQRDTKAQLIESVWELFASQGYEPTTDNSIIDPVGATKCSLYDCFRRLTDAAEVA